MDWIVAEVVQHVVHPAHVPLEGKPEPAGIGRARDAGPGSGFLGHSHGAREVTVNENVQVFHNEHGVEIFMPAELIGNPLARFRP